MLLLDFPFTHILGFTFITDFKAKMFLQKKKWRTKMPANIPFQEAFHHGCFNRHISALIKE